MTPMKFGGIMLGDMIHYIDENAIVLSMQQVQRLCKAFGGKDVHPTMPGKTARLTFARATPCAHRGN